jgi:hypothetical protein
MQDNHKTSHCSFFQEPLTSWRCVDERAPEAFSSCSLTHHKDNKTLQETLAPMFSPVASIHDKHTKCSRCS